VSIFAYFVILECILG